MVHNNVFYLKQINMKKAILTLLLVSVCYALSAQVDLLRSLSKPAVIKTKPQPAVLIKALPAPVNRSQVNSLVQVLFDCRRKK